MPEDYLVIASFNIFWRPENCSCTNLLEYMPAIKQIKQIKQSLKLLARSRSWLLANKAKESYDEENQT